MIDRIQSVLGIVFEAKCIPHLKGAIWICIKIEHNSFNMKCLWSSGSHFDIQFEYVKPKAPPEFDLPFSGPKSSSAPPRDHRHFILLPLWSVFYAHSGGIYRFSLKNPKHFDSNVSVEKTKRVFLFISIFPWKSRSIKI